ncbi:MAG: non-homologous end-joining DNA ligase [Pseudonocardia sp.]
MSSQFMPLPGPVAPMLAMAGEPPAWPGWAVEFKWDGVRAVTAVAGDRVRALSRVGNEVTAGYPELTVLGELLGGRPAMLDGELVAVDAAGRPDFGLLQHRMHVRSPDAELVARIPVSYLIFDVLHLDGTALLGEPYDRRRELLDGLGLAGPRIRVPPAVTDMGGVRMLEVARAHGLEGVVAKRRTARYEPGRRSSAWVKTALFHTLEVVIGGWTVGEGRRAATLGALLLGAYDDRGRLCFLGHVGTGFTEPALRDLLARLGPLARAGSPFDDAVPSPEARRARWVHPELVGEVVYRTFTRDRRLRHASWRGLRADRAPDKVLLQDPAGPVQGWTR